MKRKQLYWFFALCGLAIFSRFIGLTEKPFHHDEATNGWFVIQMWKSGFFRYDPSNYHGPLLFNIFQLAEVFFGDSLWTLRAVTSFFSAATIAFFCWRATRENWLWGVAAVVLAVSPAATFFSRSAIHEALLVAAFVAMLWAIEKSFEAIGALTINVFVAGLVAALALKETTVLLIAAGVIAAVVHRPPSWNWVNLRNQRRTWLMALTFGGFGLLMLFTGFLQNPRGAWDFFVAYLPWFKTGVGGNGHGKGFFYWSELILKNEFATLFLALLSLWSFYGGSRRTQFFTVLAWVHFLIYSAIPYKTPWCLISIQLPFLYAGSLVLIDFYKPFRNQFAFAIISASLAATPILWEICYKKPVDLNHPYAYVQTTYEFKKVIEFIERNRDHLFDRQIYVGTAEYWPLPWVLRHYTLIYGQVESMTPNSADLIFADSSRKDIWDTRLGPDFYGHEFSTRDARENAILYVRKSLLAQLEGRL